ncbi:MAG: hypothetical protein V4489_03805 [Chlamydiota bacterium]
MSDAIQYNFSTLFPKEDIAIQDPQTQQDIKQFKKEMDHRIQAKTVTYEWWVCFNQRLSILATPSEYRQSIRNPRLQNLMTSNDWKDHDSTVKTGIFSEAGSSFFLFPTTLGNISIDDMNKMFATQVWAVGLVNRPLIADGKPMWPYKFFDHDIQHLNLQHHTFRFHHTEKSKLISAKEKFFQMRDFLQSLSHQDPKKMIPLIKLLDFIFFSLHHENYAGSEALESFITSHSTLLSKFLQFFQYEYDPFLISHDLRYFRVSKENLFRNDGYAKALSDPKELGLLSHEKMYTFGLHLLISLLSPEITPSRITLQSDIDKLLQRFSHSTQKEQSEINEPITVSSYQHYPKVSTFVLDKSQLALYNKIVQSINNRSISRNENILIEIKKDNSNLKTFINCQTIDKVIEYFNNNDIKLSSLKIERIMNSIDRSYLEG